MKRIHESSTSALEQVDILELADRFNSEFAKDGWIATSSLSAEVMRQALANTEAGKPDQADKTILEWFTEDRIRLFAIQASRPFNKARGRVDQLEEALTLTMERRYMAAVPLILIACDGLASDVLGTSPFEKNADLRVFDSVVGHSTALPALIGTLAKGIRKSSNKALDVPFRHGILHGRSLGYANEQVCYKAWLLMIAVVDWAVDKRNEGARREEHEDDQNLDLRSVVDRLRNNAADREALDAFELVEWRGPYEDTTKPDEPPYAFCEFLNAWKGKNFGTMAGRAVNVRNESHARLAGSIRRDAELVELLAFEIFSVQQTALCRSEAVVFMRGATFGGGSEGQFKLLAFRLKPDGTPAMSGEEGTWHVQQKCIFDLMHQRVSPVQ